MSTSTKRLRCGVCGTKTELTGEFTREKVTEMCRVCRFHWHHSQGYRRPRQMRDLHRPILASAAQTQLRILFLRPSALRSEDL